MGRGTASQHAREDDTRGERASAMPGTG